MGNTAGYLIRRERGKTSSGKWNRKMCQYQNGVPILRVYHRRANGKKSARYLVKCGDCDESLEIYYGPEINNGVEIGGVLASKEEWRKILLPLLRK